MLAGAEVATPLCKPTLSCAHTLSKSRDVQRGCGWGAPAGRAVLSQPTQVEPDRHLLPSAFCGWGCVESCQPGRVDCAVPCLAERRRAEYEMESEGLQGA